jgi:hypothetical protein
LASVFLKNCLNQQDDKVVVVVDTAATCFLSTSSKIILKEMKAKKQNSQKFRHGEWTTAFLKLKVK